LAKAWGRILAKIFGYGLLALFVLIAGALTFTVGWRPVIGAKKRPLTARKFEVTPERLKRGQYLTHAVIPCMGCHSEWNDKADPPVLRSQEGAGHLVFEDGGLKVYASNITPDPETGIGNWSDDAIARAIREGIAADGSVLFPAMPYEHFRHMSDEDLASIVVYLRSMPPAHHQVPPSKVPFVIARLIQTVPKPVTEPVAGPDQSQPANHGEYLVSMGICSDCHTPRTPPPNVGPVKGMEFAGGSVFEDGVTSSNITPDASGIGYYNEALFLQSIRSGAVRARKLKPPMPWPIYRNMTDDDLKSVFAYLQTLKPVHHLVDNTEAATLCKRCGQRHGLGERN
jgi:mono/diheme cytochrome c family protein